MSKAIEYGERAARNGAENPMATLIRLYQSEGECQNYERACHYAVKIADGSQYAALCAGHFYLFGCGCEPDLNKAKRYFRLALKTYTPEAEYMLNLIKEIEEKGNVPE